MGDFNNYKLFKNVGIRSSDNKLIVMNVNKSNNVSFYSSDGGTNNIDVMSINSIINKSQNEDLNLSSLNGTTINPVITINNNHNDCRIMTNLNVYGNVNITKNLNVSNTVVNHNLIIPKYDNDNSLLSNVIGSIYYNTTENMYEGYSNDGWQPLGGFSKTKDAIIHKNVNVLQNINCTDKITSNVNIINHNLIIPKHNKDSILLSNTLGSIYYNTTENMYEGFSNEGWQPLGGFSKSKDATIYKNLNVLGNLNITGNMNQINSTQITVNDKNIVLASNNNADNHAEDGGIILQGATQKSLLWKSANGWKSSEKITAPHLDTVANQLLIGNTQVGLNLNFSGNNLHINGNIPKAGQVLIGTNSEVKWADTDYTLVNNQLIKVITETASASGIFGSASVLDLSSSNSYNQTYTTHDGYTLNNDTKKIIIIFNFAVVDSNLVSKIKLEVLIDNVSKKTVIFKNMTGNQINDFVKYFTLTSTEYGSGSKTIKFKFTDMNNTGTIKIFTEDGTSVKQPTITLQEIGDQNIKTILDETRGSKSDQIAKILVNTNATATTQILNTSQTTNYVYPYELHSSYTPSVSDTGTIIIIVNFALYISFNNNLTSKLKLELLLNNGSDTTIPQERKIILQEMNSNRSYEYTKYFSISKTAFGTGNKIELRFTDMNNSGNIKLFTNDDTNVKQPTVTIQEIGSTTGWGSSIENIPIGSTTQSSGLFSTVGIGTTSLNNGFTGSNVHTNSILDINGQTTIRGHILPSQNEQFDLGNAEYKIRHLFLSDNSLWIGDEHKIDVSGGTIKFKKRDKTKAPKKLNNEEITVEQVKSLLPEERASQINTATDVKLNEWYKYADSIGIGTTIFTSNDTSMWAEDTTLTSALSDYVTNTALSGLNYVTNVALSGLNYATQSWVNSNTLLSGHTGEGSVTQTAYIDYDGQTYTNITNHILIQQQILPSGLVMRFGETSNSFLKTENIINHKKSGWVSLSKIYSIQTQAHTHAHYYPHNISVQIIDVDKFKIFKSHNGYSSVFWTVIGRL